MMMMMMVVVVVVVVEKLCYFSSFLYKSMYLSLLCFIGPGLHLDFLKLSLQHFAVIFLDLYFDRQEPG